MLSQVPESERRDGAFDDFYRKPLLKRKREGDSSSDGRASPTPAAKVLRTEKPAAIQGVVSWSDNSSLPSKAMVLADIGARSFPDACLQLLQAVKEYFNHGLARHLQQPPPSQSLARTTSSSSSSAPSGAAASQPVAVALPGRTRLGELMADFMKALTQPLCSMEKAVRRLPPAGGNISNWRQLYPTHEAQFCAAVVKAFEEPPANQPGVGDGHSVLVHWCLFDAIFTPIASSELVVERITRIASLAVSLGYSSFLTALVHWMLCYDAYSQSTPASSGTAASPATGAAHGSGSSLPSSSSVTSKVVSRLMHDFYTLSPDDLSRISRLPELSLDLAAVFVVEFARRNPIVATLGADGVLSRGDVCLPDRRVLEMFVGWLTRYPALAVVHLRPALPRQIALGREWPPAASAAQSKQDNSQPLFPMVHLLRWSVLLPHVGRAAAAADRRDEASSPRQLEELVARLHGQVLLGLSLRQSPAAEDGGPGRRTAMIDGDSVVSLAKQCLALHQLASPHQGADVASLLDGAVERYAQLLQVMAFAEITRLSSDHIKQIQDILPSSRLLSTVLEFLAQS